MNREEVANESRIAPDGRGPVGGPADRHDRRRQLVESARLGAGLCRECVAPGFLAGGVNVTTDGGGKVPFLRKGLQGSDRVARFYAGLSRKFAGRFEYRLAEINGEPGLLRYIDGKLESAQSFVINRTQICEIYMVRNPDKLARKETKA